MNGNYIQVTTILKCIFTDHNVLRGNLKISKGLIFECFFADYTWDSIAGGKSCFIIDIEFICNVCSEIGKFIVNAFSGCSVLTEVTCEAVTPPAIGTEELAFFGCPALEHIYVPEKSVKGFCWDSILPPFHFPLK